MTTTDRTAASNRQAVLKATEVARRELAVIHHRWVAPVKWVGEQIGWTDPGANPTALMIAASDLRLVAARLNTAADRIDKLSQEGQQS